MKLYYSKGACSLAVRILIHEMNIPAEFESVDLKTKFTETGDNFLEVNPKGAVPTLRIDDNHVLTENSAIDQYLAESTHSTTLLPPIGDFNRYRVLEALSFMASDVHKGFGPLFNPSISEDLKESLFIPNLKSKLKVVNESLENKTYLMGNDFTLPDAYLFAMCRWLKKFKIEIRDYPNLAAFFETVKERPAVKKALTEEGLH